MSPNLVKPSYSIRIYTFLKMFVQLNVFKHPAKWHHSSLSLPIQYINVLAYILIYILLFLSSNWHRQDQRFNTCHMQKICLWLLLKKNSGCLEKNTKKNIFSCFSHTIANTDLGLVLAQIFRPITCNPVTKTALKQPKYTKILLMLEI